MKQFRIFIYTASNKSMLKYLMEDVVSALQELNQIVYVLDIHNIDSPKTLVSMGEDKISEFKPDFVFNMNGCGLPSPLLDKLKIPFCTWFTADPTFLLKPKDVSSYHHIFVFDRSLIPELKRRGFEQVYYLPLATNPKIFKPLYLSEGDLYRYGCDLSFAGTCSRSIGFRQRRQEIYQFLGEDLVNSLLELKIDFPTRPIIDIFKQLIKDNKDFLKDKDKGLLFIYLKFIEFEAMNLFRKLVIMSTSNFEIHLYGDDGWKDIKHPKAFFHDRIDNRTELPRLYNATKINLSLPVSTKEAVTMSTFDIPACGAFMLSSFRADLTRLFKEGEEVVCFRNRNELKDKIDYYLRHERERKEIANRARERILNEHTFVHRMKRILDVMEDFI
ncbi:MAG: glycosyltransferase [bacterium]|nr:glycosyltransferase [bacterium]